MGAGIITQTEFESPRKWMPPTRHSQLNHGMDTVDVGDRCTVLALEHEGRREGGRERKKEES